MKTSTDYLLFWGKAGGELPGEPAWHPAAYHNLDVAAVAGVLLDINPRRLASMARLFGASPANARQVIVTLIALHDVGKFAEAFQCKVQEHWPQPALGDFKHSNGPRHDQTGFDLREKLNFFELLGPSFDAGWRPSHVAAIWSAIAGHHGKPVDRNGSTETIDGARRAGIANALAFATEAASLFGPFSGLGKPKAPDLAVLSWSLAGLAVLADWIGSNRDFFPYRRPDKTLADYWSDIQPVAKRAVAVSGIEPVAAAEHSSAASLFPTLSKPSPLQALMSAVALPDGPLLAIVEDVTGSGKTEAAMLLAARLIGDSRAYGLFFVLPTMATANAMFEQLGETYRRLFCAAAPPSLVLAHGRRALHTGFQASILRQSLSQRSERVAEAQGVQSSAVCAAWVADDRRKSSRRMSVWAPSIRRFSARCRRAIQRCGCAASATVC